MEHGTDSLFSGIWKMEPAASLYSGPFDPSEETRLYEPLDNGYALTVKGNVNGSPYEWGYTAFYDGESHPVHGRADVDAIKIYKLDEFETVGFFSKNLSPGGPYRRQASKDGQTLTVEAAGRGRDGTPFCDVIV